MKASKKASKASKASKARRLKRKQSRASKKGTRNSRKGKASQASKRSRGNKSRIKGKKESKAGSSNGKGKDQGSKSGRMGLILGAVGLVAIIGIIAAVVMVGSGQGDGDGATEKSHARAMVDKKGKKGVLGEESDSTDADDEMSTGKTKSGGRGGGAKKRELNDDDDTKTSMARDDGSTTKGDKTEDEDGKKKKDDDDDEKKKKDDDGKKEKDKDDDGKKGDEKPSGKIKSLEMNLIDLKFKKNTAVQRSKKAKEVKMPGISIVMFVDGEPALDEYDANTAKPPDKMTTKKGRGRIGGESWERSFHFTPGYSYFEWDLSKKNLNSESTVKVTGNATIEKTSAKGVMSPEKGTCSWDVKLKLDKTERKREEWKDTSKQCVLHLDIKVRSA